MSEKKVKIWPAEISRSINFLLRTLPLLQEMYFSSHFRNYDYQGLL